MGEAAGSRCAGAGAGAGLVVVGAALLAGGRVLAAERSYPPARAGRWEFPGGKVGAGETERAALVRECREELGVDVRVGERLGDDLPTADGGAVLRVYAAELVAGEPVAREHRSLRWLGSAELGDVPWLAADRPLLAPLRTLLLDHAPPPR